VLLCCFALSQLLYSHCRNFLEQQVGLTMVVFFVLVLAIERRRQQWKQQGVGGLGKFTVLSFCRFVCCDF
jgi:hypothetical protein